ncbi:MAG: hypothetical protein JKY08_05510 [Flavobacteriaceae bacterium]|nr:hypothetical protein [Flavobacteriaceae bacterium]
MELIYKNDYGTSYSVEYGPSEAHNIQLVIGTVGIFMTEKDLDVLLRVVRNSHTPCNCENCGGKRRNTIWSTSSLIDFCLKVDKKRLLLIEDLIVGTNFILNMSLELDKHSIKCN